MFHRTIGGRKGTEGIKPVAYLDLQLLAAGVVDEEGERFLPHRLVGLVSPLQQDTAEDHLFMYEDTGWMDGRTDAGVSVSPCSQRTCVRL